MDEARDVVLFGFGRIGRLLTRLLVEQAGNGKKLMLRGIVVRRPKAKYEKGHLAKRHANLVMVRLFVRCVCVVCVPACVRPTPWRWRCRQCVD